MEFFVLLKFLYLALSIKSEFCSKIEVPSNFYGSPEVFSGYLSNSDWFVEAFTFHDGVLKVNGSGTDIDIDLNETPHTGIKQLELVCRLVFHFCFMI